MPELPEVESTRRSLERLLAGTRVTAVVVREPRLRWPVWTGLHRELAGQPVRAVERRAKYLLLRFHSGTLIVHFGMSGSLAHVAQDAPLRAHDHLDLLLDNGHRLRLHDPRRFGCVLWTRGDPHRHRLLRDLGPEPLSAEFDGAGLYRRARGRTSPVKSFIMNARHVAGVGNIYASEALFGGGIHPARRAGRIALRRYESLAHELKRVLEAAIRSGGTTLRDYVDANGQRGDFDLRLAVYGRAGQGCPRCGGLIRSAVIGQRSSFYCPACQR